MSGWAAARGDVLGRIEATEGTITSIEVQSSADLLANVIAGGSILSIDVAGDIGSTTQTITIDAEDGINDIEAAAVWANIDADSNASSDGQLRRVEAQTGGIKGQILAWQLRDTTSDVGIQAAGDLEIDLVLEENLREPVTAGGDLKAGSSLVFTNMSIGSSFDFDNWYGDVTCTATWGTGQDAKVDHDFDGTLTIGNTFREDCFIQIGDSFDGLIAGATERSDISRPRPARPRPTLHSPHGPAPIQSPPRHVRRRRQLRRRGPLAAPGLRRRRLLHAPGNGGGGA